MAEKSTFFNSVTGDRKYKAEDIAAHFAKLITNGVYPSGTQLQAAEDTGMDVTISAGSAWINGYAYHNDNDFTLTFDAADGVLSRIDRIVVRWGRVARSINLAIIKGTPASSPTAPAVVRSADYYDLSIATVSIGAGITAITQAMITDTRGDSTVCGFVSSLIQPDTSAWFAQFESAFNAWFETVQDILDEEAAGNLLNLINNLAGAGRTTETVKGNADALIAHKAEDATDAHKITNIAGLEDALDGKANKTQEDWITPTLLNGWTELYPVGYRKNEFGNLELKGVITGGTTTKGTPIFTLPPEYRPIAHKNVCAVSFSSTTIKSVYVNIDKSTGTVIFTLEDVLESVSLDGISVELN